MSAHLRMLAGGLAALALAATMTACGSSSSGSDEPEGKYEMEVVRAAFPTKQDLGQTSRLTIAVRNTGDKTVETAAITISIAGKEGEGSTLPFAIRDPQPDLAQPDRPVWVLAEGYPMLSGATTKRGGASSLSRKTFDFGALRPGKSLEAVWKLSAVRAGRFTVFYRVDAGLGGKAKAETDTGVAPGGSFKVQITDATPDVEVTDSGEVVEIGAGQGKKNSGG